MPVPWEIPTDPADIPRRAVLLSPLAIAAIGIVGMPRPKKMEDDQTCQPAPRPVSKEFSPAFGAGPALRCDASPKPGSPQLQFQGDPLAVTLIAPGM
jgi:hypothetical protein